MSFEADGLEHPDQIVEMARARDSAPTHAGEQLRDFQGQAPDFKGIVAAAMEMPQVRLMFWAPIGASGPPGRAALSGTKYSTWGGGYTRKREAGAGSEMEGR
jgi:hypothetical protein